MSLLVVALLALAAYVGRRYWHRTRLARRGADSDGAEIPTVSGTVVLCSSEAASAASEWYTYDVGAGHASTHSAQDPQMHPLAAPSGESLDGCNDLRMEHKAGETGAGSLGSRSGSSDAQLR